MIAYRIVVVSCTDCHLAIQKIFYKDSKKEDVKFRPEKCDVANAFEEVVRWNTDDAELNGYSLDTMNTDNAELNGYSLDTMNTDNAELYGLTRIIGTWMRCFERISAEC